MDQILVKDKDGSFKLLHDGQLEKLKSGSFRNGNTVRKPQIKIKQPKVIMSKNIHTNPNDDFDNIAFNIIKNTKLNSLADPEGLKDRLKNIIISGLKGVRTSIGLKEVLSREVDKGGLGISGSDITSLLKAIEAESKKVLSKPKDNEKKELENKPKKIKDEKKGIEALRKQYPSEDANPIDIKSIKKPEKGPKIQLGKAKQIEQKPKEEIKDDSKPKTIKLEKPIQPIVKRKPDGVTMMDVVPPKQAIQGSTQAASGTVDTRRPKLVGPIGELQYMTLSDFRRMSDDPQVRTEKILEKLDLLEEESYIQRVKGIQAWHECEVFDLYIQIGAEAMSEQKTLEEIISEYDKRGDQFLTKEEFFSINKLNKKLVL
jgi:hypothetical protein